MTDAKHAITIQSFKVSGFDIIVTTPSGNIVTLKNGIVDAIIGNLQLEDANGNLITKKDILSEVNLHSNGMDSVFLSELINSNPSKEGSNLGDNTDAAFKEKIENLLAQNAALKSDAKALSDHNTELKSNAKELNQELSDTNNFLDKLLEKEQEQNIVSALEKKTEKTVSESLAPAPLDIVSTPLSPTTVAPLSTKHQNSSSSQEQNSSSSEEDKTVLNNEDNKTVLSSSIQLSADSDSGIPGDLITNAGEPVFVGVTKPGAAISFSIDDKIYNSIADENGVWTISVSDLKSDGDYTFELQVIYNDGLNPIGENFSSTGSLTIDRSLPTINPSLSSDSDTGRFTNDNITHDQSPVIVGVTKPLSLVSLDFEGAIYSVTADANGQWSFKIPDILSDGEHEYTVNVTDLAGNSNHATGHFVVDTIVETLSTGLSHLDVVDVSDQMTHSGRPTLTGSVEPGAEVYITYNGHTGKADVDSSGQWTFTFPENLVKGENSYTVSATDVAGNTKDITSTVIYEPIVSSSLSLSEDSDSGVKGDFVTNSNKPVFQGTTSPLSSVTIYIDGNEYTTIANNDGQWTISLDGLGNGSHNFTLKVIASSGAEYNQTGELVIDRTLPPTSSSLSTDTDSGILHDDNITNIKAPVLTGKTKAYSNVHIGFHGIDYEVTANSSGIWEFKIPEQLSDGNYKYTVTITDQAGNTNSSEHSFVVDTYVSVLTAMLSPSDVVQGKGNNVTGSERPLLTGTVERGSVVYVTYNGHVLQADVSSNGDWTVSLYEGVNVGNNNYVVTATDTAGNTKSLSGSVYFSPQDSSLKLTAHLSSASDSGASHSDGVTNATKLSFDGTTSAGAHVVLTIGGKTYSTNADNKGVWSISGITNLSEGLHSYIVTATLNGKGTSVNSAVVIDTTAPVTTMSVDNALSDGANFFGQGGTLIWFRGKTEPGVKVTMNGVYNTTHTVTADQNGNWSLAWNSVTGDGSSYWPINSSFNYTLKLEDLAGNVYTSTGRYTYNDARPVLKNINIDGENLDGLGQGYHFHTNDLNPVISGSTTNAVKVRITLGGHVYEVPVSSDGLFSFRVPDGVFADLKYQSLGLQLTVYTNSGKTVTTWMNYLDVVHQIPTITGDLTPDSDTGIQGDSITSDRTPHLTGKITGLGVNANTTHVSISVDGGPLQTLTLDKDGNWLFDGFTKPLSTGEHNYNIVVTDQYGNVGNYNSNFTISDIFVNISKDTDSGVFDDQVTNFTQPIFVGKVTPGSSEVRIQFMGGFYSIKPDASGNWVFDSKDSGLTLSDGVYKITVSEVENSVVSNSLDMTFTIDTTPPNLSSVSFPDTGFMADVTNNPVLSGISDPGQKVIITLSNGTIYTVIAGSDGHWTQKMSLADGQYTYKVQATDSAGNTAEVNGSISVDTKPPSGLSWGVSDKAQYTNGNIYTADKHPVLSGYGEPGAQITISPVGDSSPGQTVTVGSDGTWSFTTPSTWWSNLPDSGTFQVIIKMTDGAGNFVSTQSGFQVVTTPPDVTVALNSGSDSGVKGDHITNITTPTFSGTTRAFSQVTLNINNKTYTTTSDHDGKWVINVSDALNTGDYRYSVNVTDVVGNKSQTQYDNVTIDSNPVPLNDVHIDGYTGDDVFSNLTDQTIVGSTSAGNKVTVIVNGKSYDTVADGSGKWSVHIDSLKDGVYNYSATAQNIAGTQSMVSSGKFTIDTVAPTTSINLSGDTDSGFKGDWLTNVASPTFTGHTKPGSQVTFTINSQDITVEADAMGNWSVTFPNSLNDGSYDFSVSVTDPAGNVMINPESGTVTIQSHYVGDDIDNVYLASLSGTSDTVTNIQNPLFSGTGPKSSNIELLVDGKTYTTTSDSTGKWTISVTDEMTDGSYTYYVWALDKAGNKSDSVENTFSIKTEPTLEIDGLDSGSDSGIVGDNITNVKTPTLSGKAAPGANITLLINGESHQVVADQNGNWSVTVTSPLNDGNIDYQVSVIEPQTGNTGTKQGQIEIDTQVPTVTESTTPPADTNNGAPLFEGTTEPHSQVSISLKDASGHTYTQTATADDSGKWSHQWDTNQNALADGKYTWSITATDPAGNPSAAPSEGTFTLDTQAPTVTESTTPPADTNNGAPLFEGTTEPHSQVSIILQDASGHTYTQTATADDSGKWSHQWDTNQNALADGKYTWSITATDPAGNPSAAPSEGTFTLDTQAPTVTESTTPPADTNNGAPLFEGTTKPHSQVSIILQDASGHTYTQTATADDSGKWSHQWDTNQNALADGKYTWSITATDPAGNPSTTPSEGAFTLDTQAPTVTESTTPPADTNNGAPLFEGTTEPHSQVSIVLKDGSGHTYTQTATADDSGKWSHQWDTNQNALADGKYTWSITATDPAGNPSTTPSEGAFTLDTQTPTVTPHSAGNGPSTAVLAAPFMDLTEHLPTHDIHNAHI